MFLEVAYLLSTHADRHGVDISVTVCFFVCVVTDISGEDKASGVKFCTVVHGRPGQGISHFGELCSPSRPKSDESATHPEVKFGVETGKRFCNRVPINIARHVDVGWACVESPKPTSFCRRRRAGCLRPAAAARRLTSTGGGGVTGKPAAAAFGGVTGQLLLMLNLNHTNEQEEKSDKFS